VLVESVLPDDDCVVEAPWLMVDDGFTLVDCWFAETPLVTSWLPFPTWTPGLMLAPAFTGEFAIPTLASTPTFGFTLLLVLPVDGDEVPELPVDDWLVLVP
jgi:hypothetical protein